MRDDLDAQVHVEGEDGVGRPATSPAAQATALLMIAFAQDNNANSLIVQAETMYVAITKSLIASGSEKPGIRESRATT